MRTSLASALLGLGIHLSPGSHSSMLTWHLATLAASQTFSLTGPEDPEVTYSWNVPSSDSNGQGDIFFQIKGPTSKSWIGLGQGNQMDHSNIFVIYANKAGNNVTLSPRAGANQVEPQEDTSAKVELLSGSGISNGMMIANIKCASSTLRVPQSSPRDNYNTCCAEYCADVSAFQKAPIATPGPVAQCPTRAARPVGFGQHLPAILSHPTTKMPTLSNTT